MTKMKKKNEHPGQPRFVSLQMSLRSDLIHQFPEFIYLFANHAVMNFFTILILVTTKNEDSCLSYNLTGSPFPYLLEKDRQDIEVNVI